ncbi:hypothetical protein [Pseudobutyrivibrio xylanivorans]|uniref:Uncharacterized protein n=1 Tax=Pseudobutyrivibrio xylanivorans TaxID=185007 RepID=A0A5P6VVQ4_PSEXY|nr:hypothetical protein [Pseudobutyrivibrio xylanivorans]QFJ55704.1 hypothetical protein FXF36_12855 [Pseudobutyrivibrio xylanivorans]
MSQSEDYLDGLLNSINKVKTDAENVRENAEKKQQEFVESRRAVSPDEDFLTANGIDVQQTRAKTSHPYLRKVLSEEDFLRKFEEELETDEIDTFLSAFEQEIDDEEHLFETTGATLDSEDVVDKLINDIDEAVSDATKQLDEEPEAQAPEVAEAEPEDASMEEPSFDADTISESDSDSESSADNDDDDSDLEIPEEDDDDIDLSQFVEEADEDSEEDTGDSSEGDDDLGFSLDDIVEEESEEEPLDESMKEFMPDDMDALDEVEFGDGEEPDLSGEGDLDLDNILEGEDEDLLDIQSLLNGDEEGALESGDIDESAEAAPASEDAGGKGGKKEKKKKEKKKKEKGEKKPNPFLQKLALIIFGAPDEDEIAEAEAAKLAGTVEITYDEEGNPIIPEGGMPEDPKEKKKREKEEKKAAKEAAKKEKEAAKKEAEAAKPKKEKKPPKPKKEKKPKEPDNSPKIPISIIATFLVLSISIIGVVMVGMTFTGLKRHMEEAKIYFDQGNYIAAYEKINGYDFRNNEKLELLRNQARTLADLQQCQDEYVTFINAKMYNYALDSLLKGIGRYEKYKDDALEYGIADEYDAFGNQIISELQETFGLSVDQAMAIYKQPNRHYYTIELRKVLRGLGLPDL